jgi:hypothetical protein
MNHKNPLKPLTEYLPNSILRISAQGVPHIVVDSYYSICWFGTKRFFRIWKGYATPKNTKLIDLKTADEVIHFVSKMQENSRGSNE